MKFTKQYLLNVDYKKHKIYEAEVNFPISAALLICRNFDALYSAYNEVRKEVWDLEEVHNTVFDDDEVKSNSDAAKEYRLLLMEEVDVPIEQIPLTDMKDVDLDFEDLEIIARMIDMEA